MTDIDIHILLLTVAKAEIGVIEAVTAFQAAAKRQKEAWEEQVRAQRALDAGIKHQIELAIKGHNGTL